MNVDYYGISKYDLLRNLRAACESASLSENKGDDYIDFLCDVHNTLNPSLLKESDLEDINLWNTIHSLYENKFGASSVQNIVFFEYIFKFINGKLSSIDLLFQEEFVDLCLMLLLNMERENGLHIGHHEVPFIPLLWFENLAGGYGCESYHDDDDEDDEEYEEYGCYIDEDLQESLESLSNNEWTYETSELTDAINTGSRYGILSILLNGNVLQEIEEKEIITTFIPVDVHQTDLCVKMTPYGKMFSSFIDTGNTQYSHYSSLFLDKKESLRRLKKTKELFLEYLESN